VTEVSIVLPAYNEGARLRQTLEALRDTVTLTHEIIVVNDASTDRGCDFLRSPSSGFSNVTLIDAPHRLGVAACRNRGAESAVAPIMITLDAHCLPRPGWLDQLLNALETSGTGIAAPQIISAEFPAATTFGLTLSSLELGVEWLHRRHSEPYEIPLAGCACLAMRRQFFEDAGRFDALRSYGMEDVEFCLRCWFLGYSVIMVPGAEVAHWFKKDPFPVAWHDYLYNRLRTAVLHFEGDRLARILNVLRAKPSFSDAVTSLLLSDIWARYAWLRERRKHDADWFCAKFGITL
jgi:GT2 family glycosyltransferase